MPFFQNLLSTVAGFLTDDSAQGRLPCSTMEFHRAAMQEDADYRARFTAFQVRMNQWVKLPPGAAPILKVPVIVHYVGLGKTPKYREDKAREQIRILNECFNARNDTSGVPSKWTKHIGDPGLEFFLPDTGPDGKSVTAVRSRDASEMRFEEATAEKVKADSPPEDPARFLNVWVCNFGSNGYATFPTARAGTTQGIVVHYQCFGTTNDPFAGKGHTLVHEVGHWLGLFHLWGDHVQPPKGDDEIADTPMQPQAHVVSPPCPDACDTGSAANAPHMFMNFMDFTPDTVRCFFTTAQAAHMRAALVRERPGILWAMT